MRNYPTHVDTEKDNKNHTHVKNVGHTPEFLFGISLWTWKTTIYLKNCWSGPIKSVSILIFTKIKKELKKNTWRYHYFMPVYLQSSWYDLQFSRYRVWKTEIVNYGSFFALLPSPIKTKKIRILKKWKKILL